VGVMSEILVGSISEASKDIGLSEFFVGVFVVAIVGNAAEHWVAVLVAAKDKMDLAVNIAIGSSAQIALFVAPVLVLLSFVVGDHPMALVFNGYELGALLFAVLIANLVTQDGESNWFEGVQLLSLYAVLGLVGLPVYAPQDDGSHLTGLLALAAPSFGYIIGFIPSAALVGWLAERQWDRKILKAIVTFVAGSVVVFAIGLPWLAVVLHTDLPTTLQYGLYPFILGGIIKAAIAAGLLPLAWWGADKISAKRALEQS